MKNKFLGLNLFSKIICNISFYSLILIFSVTSSITTAQAGKRGFGTGLAVGIGAGLLLGSMKGKKSRKATRSNRRHKSNNRRHSRAKVTPLHKDQQSLAALGFYEGTVNGQKDVKTVDAILAYQASKGIAATGVLNPEQRELLHLEASYSKSLIALGDPDIGYETKRKENKAIQSALKILGHYEGSIDGSLGRGSKKGIKAYQQEQGMADTGILVGQDVSVLIINAKSKIQQRIAAINSNWQTISSNGQGYHSPETVSSIKHNIPPANQRKQLTNVKTANYSQVVSNFPAIEPINKNAKIIRKNDIAVIIGNKNYKEGVPPVAYGLRDADAVKAMLINDLGFSLENIIDVRDAGQGAMRNVFGSETSEKGKIWRYADPEGNSKIFVYYSGHGAPEISSKKAYLVPVDADPNSLEISGYPLHLMYSNLKKIPSKSVTVVLDACFSGDSSNGMLIKSASPLVVGAAPQVDAKNFTVISASNGSQLASWDDRQGHGIFTKHVLKGLKGAADENGDKKITAGELHAYVKGVVRKDARRNHGRDQTPTLNGNQNLVLREMIN